MADIDTPDVPEAWSDLIAALQLLARGQTDAISPFNCGHDELTVCANPEEFSDEELAQLEEWGFLVNPDETPGHFYSFRYGSA